LTEIPDDNQGRTEVLGEHATNPASPRQSGEHIAALGRDWVVSDLEGRIEAQFEQWVRGRAMQVVEGEPNPELGNRLMSVYMADRAGGHYNFDGRHCRSALADLPGMRYLLFLLLRRGQPDVTEKMAGAIMDEAPRQAGVAVGWALGNSRGRGKEQDPGAAGTTAASPRPGPKKPMPAAMDDDR
jgi:hypothetical protein